jgi:hypothetical protein
VIVSLDYSFELRIFVAWANEEASRVLAYAAVGRGVDGKLVRAPRVCALAEVDRFRLGLAVLFLKARNVLVDFAEERLVACGPLLPQ